MTKKEKILYSYISNIIDDEGPEDIIVSTEKDVSKLIKRLERKNLQNISIVPKIDSQISKGCDLYIVLDDIDINESDVGIIKNLLSQKIVIFSNFQEDKAKDKNMLKLGFQTELRDTTNKLKCFSYNLKTYNNKRTWNNAKGWANPENFDKFRW
tara:strand:+ start:1540 stop:2001 length:462 start_codon:yes stop_codon:yes gene_type:complete